MGPGNRPLDLEWLEDFLALADSGNFSRAAQVRAIAQPAFSRHIKSLEEWVGVDLFDRSAQRSEEHTSELQSLRHLVCRLLLEKKNNKDNVNSSNYPTHYYVDIV